MDSMLNHGLVGRTIEQRGKPKIPRKCHPSTQTKPISRKFGGAKGELQRNNKILFGDFIFQSVRDFFVLVTNHFDGALNHLMARFNLYLDLLPQIELGGLRLLDIKNRGTASMLQNFKNGFAGGNSFASESINSNDFPGNRRVNDMQRIAECLFVDSVAKVFDA